MPSTGLLRNYVIPLYVEVGGRKLGFDIEGSDGIPSDKTNTQVRYEFFLNYGYRIPLWPFWKTSKIPEEALKKKFWQDNLQGHED